MIIVPDEPPLAHPDDFFDVIVMRVFDGDGFLAKVWHPHRKTWIERVAFRFAFIDAPEIDQQLGRESKEFLSKLIAHKALRLDPIGKESNGYSPVDSYKRLLCMAYLTDQMETGRIDYYLNGSCGAGMVKQPRSVTRNVELEMIVNGWAWVIERYSFEREEEYFAAQDDARRNRRGLWALDNPEPPWKFKQRQARRRSTSEGQGRLI